MAAQREPGQVSPQRLEQLRHPERHNARQAVQQAIASGAFPHPTKLRCVDCGEPAQEYDHFLGYAEQCWLIVHPVCIPCHGKRPRSPRDTGRPLPSPFYRVCADCGFKKRVQGPNSGEWRCTECRKNYPVIVCVCDVCGEDFALRGEKAKVWLRNRQKQQRKSFCPNCWGNQTDFREKRLAQLAQQEEPEGVPPAAGSA